MVEEAKKISSPIKDFVAGGFGGMCATVSGHPLDTIKVRLQTMPKPIPGHPPLYLGTYDCAKKTVAAEGFRGLYKGMAAPIVGVAPIFAISFLGFSLGKELQLNDKKEPLGKLQLFLAGAFAGVFTTSIMAPGERIKTLLQVQQGKDLKYKGPIDVIKILYKKGGIPNIFKGTTATLLRDVPASGMYFMTYTTLKEFLEASNEDSDLKLLATMFAGGIAGIANWVVAMPADVLKSRVQSNSIQANHKASIKKIFVELIREEGILALYKGITPVMLRAFPANAVCFIGYEFCLKFLNWLLPNL